MMNILKQRLKALFAQLLALTNSPTPQGNRILATAYAKLGTDASPKDLVPDEVGCAESVSTILSELFPPFQVITGTYSLYLALMGASEFVGVSKPLPGDIIISPTGMGNGNLPNGHTGIVGMDSVVMSNNSLTGLWDVHYTLDSWRQRYQVVGGFPIRFFRRIIN